MSNIVRASSILAKDKVNCDSFCKGSNILRTVALSIFLDNIVYLFYRIKRNV